MSQINIHLKNNILVVEGSLTHNTVMSALEQSKPLLPENGKLQVDLSNTGSSDSSGLAFLIELMRDCAIKKCKISFHHLPKEMIELSKVSGLENIIPIVES